MPRLRRVAVLAALLACAGERGRPGPPAVTIQVPPGSTIYSPDTLPFTVVAQDPDGLDSLIVTFLDSTVFLAGDFRSEMRETFNWPVPPQIPAGRQLLLSARALDLEGLEGSRTTSVTVISRPVNSVSGR